MSEQPRLPLHLGTPLLWGVLCLALATSTLAAQPAPSQPTRLWNIQPLLADTGSEARQPLPPDVKSFLFPGWGQVAQGRPAAGVAFGVLETVSLVAVVAYILKGNDAFDRFATPLEQRFSRPEIAAMMHAAGLTDLKFNEHEPFWCALGRKRADA